MDNMPRLLRAVCVQPAWEKFRLPYLYMTAASARQEPDRARHWWDLNSIYLELLGERKRASLPIDQGRGRDGRRACFKGNSNANQQQQSCHAGSCVRVVTSGQNILRCLGR